MSYIRSIKAIEILDSRGMPTIQVDLTTDKGFLGRMGPEATGEHEAIELRDGDQSRYFGRGVQKAVAHVNDLAQISPKASICCLPLQQLSF